MCETFAFVSVGVKKRPASSETGPINAQIVSETFQPTSVIVSVFSLVRTQRLSTRSTDRPYHCDGCRRGAPCVHRLHVQDEPLLLLFVQLRSGLDGSAGTDGEQVGVRFQCVGDLVKVTSRGGPDAPHCRPRRLVLGQAEVVGGPPEDHALHQADDPQIDHDTGCRKRTPVNTQPSVIRDQLVNG